METSAGSGIQKIIGMGTRVDKETGKSVKLVDTYPTFFNHFATAFEHYPIYERFGITIEEAMAMPIDRWYRIRKISEKIYENKPAHEPMELILIQLVKELIAMRSGSE